MRGVWLVLDNDRNVLDVCESEETALTLAESQDAFAEWWPITTSPRERAWTRAINFATNGRALAAAVATSRKDK